MGKSIEGKELGEGITQRSDKLYVARFRYGNGKRLQKVFKDLNDARQWMVDCRFQYSHKVPESIRNNPSDFTKITMDEWYDFWNESYNENLSPNTIRNYNDRYTRNVSPIIGKMKVSDVRSIHCQMILNDMKKQEYSAGTVYQTYICLGVMFRVAINNDIIFKHPLTGVTIPKGLKRKTVRALTLEEQKAFLEAIEHSHNRLQYRLILQTGLRTGEMIGLTWDCIDFEKRELYVVKQMEFRHKQHSWRASSPKTVSGFRTVPLTDEAYDILAGILATKDSRKCSPELDQVLTYTDTKELVERSFNMKDLVFINFRTGMPN